MARPRRASAASETSTLPEGHQELGSMYDYLAKVILLGPSGSGKSCLLHRFVRNEWRILSSQTIGVEFASKIVRIGTGIRRRRIKLQLWDTAGTERFRSVSRSYYRGAAGAILVYDIASLSSFNSLPTFHSDAKALASPNLTVILAGNKTDLSRTPSETPSELPLTSSSTSSKDITFHFDAGSQNRSRVGSVSLGSKWTATTSPEGREVNPDVASRWASKSGIPVTVEVSAFSGENVEELFNRLARMILTKIELGVIDPDDPQSGIQYGDGSGWDGSSVKSGPTFDDESVRKRRPTKRAGNGLLSGMSDWEEVFKLPGAGRRRGCC